LGSGLHSKTRYSSNEDIKEKLPSFLDITLGDIADSDSKNKQKELEVVKTRSLSPKR
jgi:hypothetical protein